MSNKKVLIATKISNEFYEWLLAEGYELEAYSKNKLIEWHAYEGIVTSNMLYLPQELLIQCWNLKWIGRMGSGMEIIDVEYAKSQDIEVFASPDGNANAVAEQALGMLLSLFHEIHNSSVEVLDGMWEREGNRGFEIEGKRIGIVGLGNNGSATAKKMHAMGMEVFYYDKYLAPEFTCDYATRVNTYEELLTSNLNVLSFHVPLNKETEHYFNAWSLGKMSNPFYLLNLSRGPVVSWKAVKKGLEEGVIIKVALDVLEKEPMELIQREVQEEMRNFIRMHRLLITPHIGGYTYDAIDKMSASLMRQIKKVISKE